MAASPQLTTLPSKVITNIIVLLLSQTNSVTSPLFIVLQVRGFVDECVRLCQPSQVHVCDGTDAENESLIRMMQEQGMLEALPKMDNW